MSKRGSLVILVGPSGSGKGTVLKELLQTEKNTFLSVSATTRKPRLGEEHGKNYFFISEQEFLELKKNGGLLEYTNYCGNYYGTPKEAVEQRISHGENVILEIEVEGARNVRRLYPEAIAVFILPPSFTELKRRLTNRQTEDEETIRRRLEKAEEELSFAYECDYVVVNDRVEQTAAELGWVIRAQACRADRMEERIGEVLRG